MFFLPTFFLTVLAAVYQVKSQGICDCRSSGGDIGFITQGGVKIVENSTVFLTPLAELPMLSACYCGPEPKGAVWSLDTYPTGKDTVCGMMRYLGKGRVWLIGNTLNGQVVGGNFLLGWTDGKLSGKTFFKVRGTPPLPPVVTAKIVSEMNLTWYAPFVALRETKLQQFDLQGIPLRSTDDRYGIFQIKWPRPTCEQIWSWVKNVEGGIARLQLSARLAKRWMTIQRAAAKASTPASVDIPVTPRVEANCKFADGTPRPIEDAVAMKIYNGASFGHYCAWDSTLKTWKFNPINIYRINYVESVCKLVPPTPGA